MCADIGIIEGGIAPGLGANCKLYWKHCDDAMYVFFSGMCKAARKAKHNVDHRYCRVDGQWNYSTCEREAETRQKWRKVGATNGRQRLQQCILSGRAEVG